MNRTSAILSALVALGLVTAATAAVSQAADDPATGPVATLGTWASSSTARPSALQLDALDEVARGLPGVELASDRARVVPVAFARELVVAPTTDPDTRCIAAVDGVAMPLRLCGNRFPESGVSATYHVGPGTGPNLIGVVADDVTSITIVLADGTTSDVDPEAGAFWYDGEHGDRIERVEIVRDGHSYSEIELFESAALA